MSHTQPLKTVYVMAAGGKIKIGVAKNPHSRLKKIQASMPWKVSLVAVWDVPSERVFKVERWAHRYLEAHREQGEWFNCSMSEVMAYEGRLFTIAWGHDAFQGDCECRDAADHFALNIMRQGRWMTLAEQQVYFGMVAAEPRAA